jgi:hypothetical protein
LAGLIILKFQEERADLAENHLAKIRLKSRSGSMLTVGGRSGLMHSVSFSRLWLWVAFLVSFKSLSYVCFQKFIFTRKFICLTSEMHLRPKISAILRQKFFLLKNFDHFVLKIQFCSEILLF